VDEALDLGFVAYLKKPLDLEELCRVVHTAGRSGPA
jgi:hypothetical protein